MGLLAISIGKDLVICNYTTKEALTTDSTLTKGFQTRS